MNWIGLVAALAIGAIIISVVTDVGMTTCGHDSLYATLHFCKPDKPTRKTNQLECRFDAERSE